MMAVHVPVLLDEVLEALAPRPGAVLFDGTLGLGGHSSAWLAATRAAGEVGRVVGTDRDVEALQGARARLDDEFPGRVHYHHGSYEEVADARADAGVAPFDAALLDLGASSLQLDRAERGFSFARPGPLDMRMDASADLTAADIVNEWQPVELERIFRDFGEEPGAARVAAAIATERRRAPFRDTLRLAETVARATGGRRGRLHPATRVFQALRIAVNDELGRVERALPLVAGQLAVGGRFGILTFHRLEDRLAKRFFRAGARSGQFRLLPDRTPTRAEERANPRSRSARLRAAEVLVAGGDR